MTKSEPATISERENGVDRISNLPDHILHLILSGLPSTEEVVRTSILSGRWRYQWTSVPVIDIDYRRGLDPLRRIRLKKSKKFVDRILANKSVDLDRFRLCCLNCYDMLTIGRWIHAALTRNVKLLDLMFFSKEESEHINEIQVPESPVTCDSLEELRLNLFRRPLKLPYFAEFQAVTVLVLNSVDLSSYDSCDRLTQLNNLDNLSLIDCFVNGSTSASCPKLKNLRIVNSAHHHGISGDICICCLELEFLELTGLIAYDVFVDNPNPLKKAVIHQDFLLEGLEKEVTYLDLFANISRVESLSIGLYFLFQFIKEGGVIPPLHNLKTLEITTTIDSFTLDVILQFLIHPNLESLHLIIQEDTFGSEYWEMDDTETMKILTSHLKRVEFVEFDEYSKLDIARSLLEQGNALEEMVFSWNNKNDYDKMSMKTMKKVSNFHKASSIVKLTPLLKDYYFC